MLAPSLATAAALRLPLFPGAGRAAAAAAPGRSPRRTPRTAIVILAAVVGLDALAGTPRTANRALPPDSPPALGALLRGAGAAARATGARHDSLAAAPAPFDAFLVTSVRDCASNLGVLDLLARETIAPRVRLAGALVVTPTPPGRAPAAADTAAATAAVRTVREAIAARGLPTTPAVRALDPPTALLLRRIGYRETPFLVVLDSTGTLRFATPSPPSFAEHGALARTLSALAAGGSSAAPR